jgi:hypothetical protein
LHFSVAIDWEIFKMNSNMATSTAASRADVDYSPFEDQEDFFLWVATIHGNEVCAACSKRISEELGKGHFIKAKRIVDQITYPTDQVDLTKVKLRARFAW